MRLDENGVTAVVASTQLEPIPGAHAGNDRGGVTGMMSETRKKIVAELKDYAAKQVEANKDSQWQKLLKLSDQQIAAVSGGTAGFDGAKGRASKFVRSDEKFLEKLPSDFGKLADPKYVAAKDAKKAAEETTAAPKPPAAPKPSKAAQAEAVKNLETVLAGPPAKKP
jgi:hypothetical protein